MPEVWCWYKNVYGWNHSSWSAVRVDAGKHVDFFLGSVLSTAERSRVTDFTTDKAYGRAAVSRGGVGKRWKKPRSVSTILVFFGLDPAPPSFRHARPPKWCWCVRLPAGLDSSVLGPVSNSVVPDLFRKSARQEKRRNVPPRSIWEQTCGDWWYLSGEGEYIFEWFNFHCTR